MPPCRRADARTLKAVVRPGFSFLGGQIRLTVTLAESTPPTGALMRVHAQGIGVQMNVESRLALEPLDGGARTRLAWTARGHDFKGLVVAVPATLVRAAADKTITDGWRALRPRIEQPAA